MLIDFSLAQEVSDVALAAMLVPIRDGEVRLRFRGLMQRQRQLIRLLAPVATESEAAPVSPTDAVNAPAANQAERGARTT